MPLVVQPSCPSRVPVLVTGGTLAPPSRGIIRLGSSLNHPETGHRTPKRRNHPKTGQRTQKKCNQSRVCQWYKGAYLCGFGKVRTSVMSKKGKIARLQKIIFTHCLQPWSFVFVVYSVWCAPWSSAWEKAGVKKCRREKYELLISIKNNTGSPRAQFLVRKIEFRWKPNYPKQHCNKSLMDRDFMRVIINLEQNKAIRSLRNWRLKTRSLNLREKQCLRTTLL